LERLYLEMNSRNSSLKAKLLKHINAFLDTIETREGFIIRDATQIAVFQAHMDKFFQEHGIEYLAFLSGALTALLKEAARQFEDDGAEYKDVAFIKEMYGIKGDKVMSSRNGQPTALYALVAMAVIRQDIINKLQGAMVGDTRMPDFRGAVEKSVSRKYHDFFEVNATSILFNSYNAATRHFAKKYGYKRFVYEGGLIKDSRDFCIERDGLTFHDYQGEAWNDLEWKGKMQGVDFFVQIGGHNCRHWLVWLKD
jgi:hypothetical protein